MNCDILAHSECKYRQNYFITKKNAKLSCFFFKITSFFAGDDQKRMAVSVETVGTKGGVKCGGGLFCGGTLRNIIFFIYLRYQLYLPG